MKNAVKNFLFPGITPQTNAFEIMYALFRFYCGFSIAYGAGFSKVFHKINEDGPKEWSNLAFGVPEWFTKMVGEIGFTFISPSFWAHLAVYGEFIGGILIALGLFTRLSAIQMVFQFFVVSFIWYESPMPFAMYYQQLIFWSFALIAVVGSGKYSLDYLRSRKTMRMPSLAKPALVISIFLTSFSLASAQKTANPVAFTIKNKDLNPRSISIRYFDRNEAKPKGYGLDLGPLQSEAVNMPAGTRIYRIDKNNKETLFAYISTDYIGKTIDLGGNYAITQEQWLQAANDELAEKTLALESADENKSLEKQAAEAGVPLVHFTISGRYLWPTQAYIRIESPFDPENPNLGFSKPLNRLQKLKLGYPVGTKVFQCEGPYWNGRVAEKLILIVDLEKENYHFRL